MAGNVTAMALEIGEKIAAQQGVYLVDAEFVKEGKMKYLRLYIDKEGGTGIDDCENFSNAFGEEFDRLDPIEENYCLEVSSPGVDRILKKEREFLYYIGKKVDVKLYQAKDGVKEFTGILKAYQDKTVDIEAGEKQYHIPVKEAASIRLHFEI